MDELNDQMTERSPAKLNASGMMLPKQPQLLFKAMADMREYKQPEQEQCRQSRRTITEEILER